MADDKHKHPQGCDCPHHHQHESPRQIEETLDPGNQALSEALRISFGVLKLVMIGVVVLFIWSGFFRVEQNQQALLLRFGRVLGSATQSILEPGWHWKCPDPIDEVVYLPVQEQNLTVDSFWYYQDDREKAGGRSSIAGPTLQIVKDGYSICASQPAVKSDSTDTNQDIMIDYNLVHTQWKLRYIVDNPREFFDTLWDGRQEHYNRVDHFLITALEDSVIRTSASHDIDWMLWRDDKSLSSAVLDTLRQRVNAAEVGIRIEALDLVGRSVPRQVQSAFDLAAQADNEAGKLAKEASARYEEIVNQARAQASITLAEAQAYKTRIVQAAQADAKSLEVILQQIYEAIDQKIDKSQANWQEQRQKMFNELLAIHMDQIYQEAIRFIVASADEVIVPSSAGEDSEWRIYMSRDATLKPQNNKNESAPQNPKQ